MKDLQTMRKRELCAELKSFGITRGYYSERKPDVLTTDLVTPQLCGMLQRQRTRAAAKAAGAAPCTKHDGEYEGDCPRCRGIWPEDY